MEKKLSVPVILFVFILALGGCNAKNKATVINAPPVSISAAQSPVTASPVPASGENASVFDFGQLKAGQIVQHQFILRNEAQLPLVIKDINTSCGCTVSEVKKRFLVPGESTAIDVKFNSTGYNGPVEQFIYVHTDRAESPVLKFTIKADVVK